jgi:hypothetical protein
MESTKVGFFTQLKGIITKKRYRYCTVFVDQLLVACLHLQVDDSAAKTILAKQAFKKFAAKHGICIQHYHVFTNISANIFATATASAPLATPAPLPLLPPLPPPPFPHVLQPP